MENRRSSRVSVETQCKARFQLGEHRYNNITVSNLGQDGCCLTGSRKDLETINERGMLENLELIHPALPKEGIKGQVVWVHRLDQGVETGVHFLNPKGSFVRDVGKYVSTMAAPESYGAGEEWPPIPD
jgi:hypothetical protein